MSRFNNLPKNVLASSKIVYYYSLIVNDFKSRKKNNREVNNNLDIMVNKDISVFRILSCQTLID